MGIRTYSQDEAANQKSYAQDMEQAQNAAESQYRQQNPGASDQDIRNARYAAGVQYSQNKPQAQIDPNNPGSAWAGGSRDAADFYRQQALNGMASNDAEQASNAGAMNSSLAAMLGQDGHRKALYEDLNGSLREQGTRNQQLSALELNRQAALGNAPSAAAFQTRMGMNNLMGQNAGAQGSARGLAGLTGAQTAGMGNVAAGASDIAAQGGMARSKEISDATGMLGSFAGDVRGQDINRLGISNQNALAGQQNQNQWQVGNANLLANQANLGSQQAATDQQWMSEWAKPADKQFRYDQEMAAMEAGANADAAAQVIESAREKREHERQLAKGVITTGLTAVGSMAGPVGAAAGAGAGQAIGSATDDFW